MKRVPLATPFDVPVLLSLLLASWLAAQSVHQGAAESLTITSPTGSRRVKLEPGRHEITGRIGASLLQVDEKRRRIEQGGLWVRDNVIEIVGPSSELPQKADRVIDA